MSGPNRDIVCVEGVTVVRSTDSAGLYRTEDGTEVWVPWSQVDDRSVDKDGASGELWIPRWLAESKDLEYSEED